MFSDYIELGPTPCEEDCAQVGQDNYRSIARKEAMAFVKQLNREFFSRVDRGLIEFGVKWFNHDFGSYCEAVVYYNPSDPESANAAIFAENNTPMRWDEESLIELDMADDNL